MPNWVTNRLTVKAEEERVNEVLDFVKNDESGVGSIDFNKIVPMPETVFRGNLGEQERRIHGSNNWYDWGVQNWGVKWNTGNEIDGRNEGNVLYFDTAWSAPLPAMLALSKQFPDIEFELAFADEDLGHNVGIVQLKEGEIAEEDIPDGGSFEARKMFFDITQSSPEEYGMDPETLEYKDEEDEEEN